MLEFPKKWNVPLICFLLVWCGVFSGSQCSLCSKCIKTIKKNHLSPAGVCTYVYSYLYMHVMAKVVKATDPSGKAHVDFLPFIYCYTCSTCCSSRSKTTSSAKLPNSSVNVIPHYGRTVEACASVFVLVLCV